MKENHLLKSTLVILGLVFLSITANAANKVDSLLSVANSLNEMNYTIPSWTLL